MKKQDSIDIDDKILRSFDANTLTLIRKKGPKMDAEIAAKQKELQTMVYEGFSSDGLVKVKVDGCHQVIDTIIDPKFTDWEQNKAKTCTLMTEAVNDAIYKIDLTMETEISTIQNKYIRDIIEGGASS